MFGHFKAEEFLNLIEGASLPAERRTHLDSCEACRTRLRSVESVHSDLSTAAMSSLTDMDIPEPDWEEFRTSVRTGLLSRSVQRESAVRRWTGWPIRPAMAWGLSLGLLVCVMTGGFLWHVSTDRIRQAHDAQFVEQAMNSMDSQEPSIDISAGVDPAAVETEKAVWANAGVFETVAQLNDEQAEQLRRLLASAPAENGTFQRQ